MLFPFVWLMGLFRDRSSSKLPHFNLVAQVNNGSLLDWFSPYPSNFNAPITGLSGFSSYGGLRLGSLSFRWDSCSNLLPVFDFKRLFVFVHISNLLSFHCRWFQVVGSMVRCAPRFLTSSPALPLRVVSPHVVDCNLFIVLSLVLLVVRLLSGKINGFVICVTLLRFYSLVSAPTSIILSLSFC